MGLNWVVRWSGGGTWQLRVIRLWKGEVVTSTRAQNRCYQSGWNVLLVFQVIRSYNHSWTPFKATLTPLTKYKLYNHSIINKKWPQLQRKPKTFHSQNSKSCKNAPDNHLFQGCPSQKKERKKQKTFFFISRREKKNPTRRKKKGRKKLLINWYVTVS